MSGENAPLAVNSQQCQVRLARAEERCEGLALLFRRPGVSAARRRREAEAFADFAERQGLDLTRQWLVFRGGTACSACMLMVSAGRCGTIMLSAELTDQDRLGLLEGLRLAVDEARVQRLRLVQGLIEPGAAECELLGAAGFTLLGRLQYLERQVSGPLRSPPETGLSWASYNDQTHDEFAEVIAATYEETLDCPALTGVRDMDDVIAAHKASGLFEPNGWLLLRRDGQGVGVLLLNKVVYRSALEIVYMGVLPSVRGSGLSRVLVARALSESRQRNVCSVLLAVDENNWPARNVYESFGFAATTVREAWVSILERADAVGI